MQRIRTDLAEELRSEAISTRAKDRAGELDGILYRERTEQDVRVSTVEIVSEAGERAIGKPMGVYTTLSFPTAANLGYQEFLFLCDTLAKELRAFTADFTHTLVCGIGNRAISADALGVIAAENVLVTHHLQKEGILRGHGYGDVSAFVPGTTAKTGTESASLIHSVVDKLRPDAVIVIDALAARETHRLARTVQISDTGLSPGSGIGNHREALDKKSLGVPVIAIGVPTVVDTATLVRDAFEGRSPNENILRSLSGLFVAPKEIDAVAKNMGKLIGYAINRALHGDFSYEEMAMMA